MGMSNAFLLYRKCGGTRRQEWFRSKIIHSLITTEDRPAEVSVVPKPLLHHKASTFLGCQANTTWTFYRRHGARSLQLLNVLCAASEDNAEKHATFVGLVLLHLFFAWCLVSRITILRKTSSRKFSDDDEFC